MDLKGWIRRLPRGVLKRTAITFTALLIAAVAIMLGVRAQGSPWPIIGRGLNAPAPQSVLDTEWVPELPLSTLSIPITYDLTPVIEALEGAVPWRYGSLADRYDVESNDRAAVAFTLRRGPFRARLVGDVARLSTTITYQGRGWYDPPLLPEIRASCGTDENEGPPRAIVAISARIALYDDWRLGGRAWVDRVVAASQENRDRCRVTPLNIDVTERVLTAANGLIVGYLPQMEAAIARIDLRSRVERWWEILHQPIELTDNVWLNIEPVSVHRGETEGRGQTLVASVGITARPRIVLGDRPRGTLTPLPPLDTATVEEGLRIHATGRADYRNISEQLNARLSGAVLEREGRTLEVQELRLRGIGGGRLSLEMTFGGSTKGRLFLVGTPEFDAQSGQVHVPDLRFDVASSSLLVSGYAWLREQGVTDFLRERARWPVQDIATLAETQLRRGLNRRLSDDVELRGEVHSVEILGVYAMLGELVVHAQANAVAELVIRAAGEEVGS